MAEAEDWQQSLWKLYKVEMMEIKEMEIKNVAEVAQAEDWQQSLWKLYKAEKMEMEKMTEVAKVAEIEDRWKSLRKV